MNGRLVVAITGASGAIYALRFIKAALELGLRLDVVVTDYGHRLLIEECGLNLKRQSFAEWIAERYGAAERPGSVSLYREQDLDAPIASGSHSWDAMVIIPCSMKTLSGVACGRSSNLVERAADVTLKERRPLVLVPRETPLHLIHLENMTRAVRAGAHVVPAMPAFYHAPASFEDLADFIAGRVLASIGMRHDLVPPWNSREVTPAG